MNILILGPNGRNERVLSFLEKRGHCLSCTTEPVTLGGLSKMGTEFLISNGYAPILKGEVVQAFPGKIINLHPTFLPYGRGINPNFWSFFENSPKGVSIHFINEGIDTGDIICQKAIEFTESDTLRTSYDTLLKETEALFFEIWPEIEVGKIHPKKQDSFGLQIHYRSRLDSEKMMALLPQRWDTSVKFVEQKGHDFCASERFFQQVRLSIEAKILQPRLKQQAHELDHMNHSHS